jgi:hypothetical protein
MLRYEDANLHSIAHQRVAELAACACLEHDGMRSGTAEVIAYNEGFSDSIGRAVSGWQHSASHNALLSDPTYGRIGCAEVVSEGVHWFACVLAKGALPPQPAPAPPVGAAPLLPNTAVAPPAP